MRLEQSFEYETALLHADFNSIKVRLELGVIAVLMYVVLFQFHKGAIRTMICNVIILILCYFNSIKVRLELRNEAEYVFSCY